MHAHDSANNKVAIVTGAAHRIGAAIVRHLHQQHYNVVLHYRHSEAAARKIISDLNQLREDSAIGVQAELTEVNAAEKIVNCGVDQWGQLDLLVNNASEFYPTPVGTIAANDVHKLLATNVQAPLMLSQAAFAHLQKTAGSVVNIIDIYADIVHPEHSVYCASKAALAMLTKSLAVEMAPSVRVNGVSPGAILWPEGEEKSLSAKEQMISLIPLNKIGSPQHIADTVLYLATAGYTTGQILSIDGGRTL